MLRGDAIWTFSLYKTRKSGQFSSVVLYMDTPEKSELIRFPTSILSVASPLYYHDRILQKLWSVLYLDIAIKANVRVQLALQ